MESCTCDKLNGYCMHSKTTLLTAGSTLLTWTLSGNIGRRSQATFDPRKKRLVRPRLEDVISKMRREQNAATEEALAKSRGTKAYMSWRVKKAKAKAARAREREEEVSPTSSYETPPVENATMSEDLTQILEHNKPRRKKRKRKAQLEGSQKRQKAVSDSGSVVEDTNTTEQLTATAHKDNNSKSDAQRGDKSSGGRMSPVVEIIRKLPSADSLQRGDNSATIPYSVTNPAQNASRENYVTVVDAIVKKAEDLAKQLKVESTPPRLATSRDIALRGLARDATDNVQLIPHNVAQESATADYGSLATKPSINFKESGVMLKQGSDIAGLDAQLGIDTHGEQTHAEPVKALILLDSDSDDDIEITSVKIADPNLKQAHSHLRTSSPKNSLGNKHRRLPKSDLVDPPNMKLSPSLLVKTPSQGGKRAPPGLRELPEHTARRGYAGLEFEGGPSTEKSSDTRTPARTQSQGGKGRKKGTPSQSALPSTKFIPTLVGKLLGARPGPILIDDDLEEELTSPESSPGPGIARLEIEIGPKEMKFVRQKPLPISISSDEGSDEDSPSGLHMRTTNELRLQYQNNMSNGTQIAIAAGSPVSQQGRLHKSNLSREPKSLQKTLERQDIWPAESRGELAQAAADYLNSIPHNRHISIGVTEMLNLLGEQPEFDTLCSQIKKSGRVLAKPAFANAILSKLEPEIIEEPKSSKVFNRTESPKQSKVPTPVKYSSNISRKMTPGRVADSETRNATQISANAEVIVIDAPASIPPTKTGATSSQTTHQHARKDEVLNYIAERILLQGNLGMLPKFIDLTIARVVEEEYNLFEAEKAVAKREAEKATNERVVRQPDFSVYKRVADRTDRVEETSRNGTAPSFEWTWNYSQHTESERKMRGRSTSVALSSVHTAQAPSQGQALLLTPRKVHGRSTTPEIWLNSSPGRVRVDQDGPGNSMDSDGDSIGSSDAFFDAKQRPSTEIL
ncbi:hypothetical protein E6O75_ATG00307 [Venturia nashicola]|uniref:Uncharacterized protein n=1 Tax=Venturia nashicola TaxID=86259 RepID=A0A4Z1PVT2_9PEZI|nr:hypothetical protein E6O75_ATG00307 [Venturia nashicola]